MKLTYELSDVAFDAVYVSYKKSEMIVGEILSVTHVGLKKLTHSKRRFGAGSLVYL